MSFICSDMFGRYPPMWKVQLDEPATRKCDYPACVCYWKGLVPTYLLTAMTSVKEGNFANRSLQVGLVKFEQSEKEQRHAHHASNPHRHQQNIFYAPMLRLS